MCILPGVYISHLDMGEGTLFPPAPQYFTEVSHPTGVHIYGGTPQGYKGDLTLQYYTYDQAWFNPTGVYILVKWLVSTILLTKHGSTPPGYLLVKW